MNHRHARVQKELLVRIAEILATRARDPGLQGLQVLEVRASTDFSYARVFFRMSNDDPESIEAALAALGRAKGFVRTRLARGMSIRRIPELDFRYDVSPERAARVYEILETTGEGTS